MKKLQICIVGLLLILPGSVLAQSSNPGNAAFKANALTNAAVSVKAVPGVASVLHCSNPSSNTAYVQFFDTIGAVTVGVTAPKYFIGFTTQQSADAIMNVNFTAGIQIAATTTPTGAGAPDQALNCSLAFE